VSQQGASPLTNTEMEKLTGMTGRAIAYAFHERFGCSPQDWQRNHFLNLSRKFMLEARNATSVKEIAYRFGFSSQVSFSTFYTRKFGERPSETLNKISLKPTH